MPDEREVEEGNPSGGPAAVSGRCRRSGRRGWLMIPLLLRPLGGRRPDGRWTWTSAVLCCDSVICSLLLWGWSAVAGPGPTCRWDERCAAEE